MNTFHCLVSYIEYRFHHALPPAFSKGQFALFVPILEADTTIWNDAETGVTLVIPFERRFDIALLPSFQLLATFLAG